MSWRSYERRYRYVSLSLACITYEPNRDGRVFGFEVKAGGAPQSRDARHLAWLRDELGERFIGGAVLHTGPHTYPLGDRIVAAPIATVWA